MKRNLSSISWSTKDLKNSKWVRKISRWANQTWIAKALVIATLWIGCLIPVWLYCGVRWLSSPEGFWQELAIVIIMMVVVGWIQVILAFAGFIISVSIMIDDTI